MLLDIKHTMQQLQKYADASYQILSVYQPIPKQKSLLLTSYDNLITYSLSEAEQKEMFDEIRYIRNYLQYFRNTHNYRGIALFSSKTNIWEVITTPFSLPSKLALQYSPYLEPLNEQLDTYKRYLIVLADRKKARFFTLSNGVVEEKEMIIDDSVPQKVKSKSLYDSAWKIDRQLRDHLRRHLQLIGDRVEDFIHGDHIAGVIVGSHKEMIHELEKHLPKYLQQKIIGEFSADTDEPDNMLLERGKKFIAHHHS